MRTAILLILGVLLFGTASIAAQESATISLQTPYIAATCKLARCERTGDVLSVPAGTEIEFRIIDTNEIEAIVWSLGDGIKQYELSFPYKYFAPGSYTVTATVYYANSGRAKTSMTVHVIAAPPAASNGLVNWLDRLISAVIGAIVGYISK